MKVSLTVLQLSGILDRTRGNELRREISGLLANGTNIFLLDMKEIKLIDSTGLGALVSVMQMVHNTNGKLFLCSISDQVRMLFEMTKVDRIFKIFTDQEEFNRKVLVILSGDKKG
ncbi:MAG: STAS domain-containing protein [Nostoc sp.]|uniref:STAS domain-containing protein n=1 Tax=Nostoc sp. TaxID=1180 RepID=UPI002FFD2540